jgi:hypothetical protein
MVTAQQSQDTIDKTGDLLYAPYFPCFTNIASPNATPFYQQQTKGRLVIVLAQELVNNLVVLPITSQPGPLRVPISVSFDTKRTPTGELALSGHKGALKKGNSHFKALLIIHAVQNQITNVYVVSYVNLAQITTIQWGTHMPNTNEFILQYPPYDRRANLIATELIKLRQMFATLVLGLRGGQFGNGGDFGTISTGVEFEDFRGFVLFYIVWCSRCLTDIIN